MILEYLQSGGQPWRAFDVLGPYSEAQFILPFTAGHLKSVNVDTERTFSCYKYHRGNSGIHYRKLGLEQTGFIRSIYRIPISGALRTFFVVERHKDLAEQQARCTPYFRMHGFQTKVVRERSGVLDVIEQDAIVTHLTFYVPEKVIYGLKEVLVICWALNRGRK
jgi:hypothetical protein